MPQGISPLWVDTTESATKHIDDNKLMSFPSLYWVKNKIDCPVYRYRLHKQQEIQTCNIRFSVFLRLAATFLLENNWKLEPFPALVVIFELVVVCLSPTRFLQIGTEIDFRSTHRLNIIDLLPLSLYGSTVCPPPTAPCPTFIKRQPLGTHSTCKVIFEAINYLHIIVSKVAQQVQRKEENS